MDINMTLLGEVITFLLFVLFTMKFIWPPVVKAMQERQQKIADGLASAERGKRELELAKNKAVEILHESRDDADQLIEKANIRADQMVNEAKAQGRIESQRIINDAQVEIAHEVTNAKNQLKTELAHFVLQGAEKILSKEVDARTHEKMLDELITEIE